MGTHNRLAGEAELVITWRMITIGFCAISFLWWLGDAWRSGNDLGYVNALPCAIRSKHPLVSVGRSHGRPDSGTKVPVSPRAYSWANVYIPGTLCTPGCWRRGHQEIRDKLLSCGSSSIASETSLLLLSSMENYPERKLLSVEIRDLTVSLLCVYIKSGTMIIPLGMRSSLGHHL